MLYRLFLSLIFIFSLTPVTLQAASVEMLRLSQALLAEAEASLAANISADTDTQSKTESKSKEADRFAQADAQLTHALLADPANAEAFILKGRIAALRDDPAEAWRLIDLGLNIKPDHLEGILWAGQAALMLDDREDAEKRLARLGKLCGTCAAQKTLQRAIEEAAATPSE